MDITWLGGGTYLIKGGDLTVLTDPLDAAGKLRSGLPNADVATFSRGLLEEPLPEVKVKRRVVRTPGEFEIGGAFFYGTKTYRDPDRGAKRGPNLIFRVVLDGIRICHLGEVGHTISPEQATTIGDVDVLILPIGENALSAEAAADAISELEPKVIMPFPTDGTKSRVGLEKLLKDLGLPITGPLPKLTLTRQVLQEPQRIVALDQQ